MPEFVDNEGTLFHAVNIEKFMHFQGVTIPRIAQRKSIDILIGQTDKFLLAVLEERESKHPNHHNYVLTRLGPIASDGRLGARWSVFCENFKIQVDKDRKAGLKESLRNYEI